MLVVIGIITLIMLAATVVVCFNLIREQGFGKSREIIMANIGMILFIVVGVWFFFPTAAHYVFYRGMFLHIFDVALLLIGWIIFKKISMPLIRDDRGAMGIVFLVLAILIAGGGIVTIESLNNFMLYEHNKPQVRDEIVETDSRLIRYTPLQVAHTGLENTFGSSRFQIEKEHARPIIYRNAFHYLIPITPDGLIPTLDGQNPGFMLYNDSLDNVAERIFQVNQTQRWGVEMEYLDNLYRKLHALDKAVVYGETRYYPLDPDNDQIFTAITPRIKYRYNFPCFFVPVWDGVVLYDGQEKFEVLTADQALSDNRLNNLWLQSETLHRQIVEAQVYDEGWHKGWFWWNREGKIQIPEVPGFNQMPYYTTGKDSRRYLVTLTEPYGESHSVYRVYFQDAHTGKLTVKKYPINSGLIGPVVGIDLGKSAIEGLVWVKSVSANSKTMEIGDYDFIEPVYVTRNKQLWYKYTVTTKAYASITWTVVLDANSDPSEPTILKFKTRTQFQTWLEGGEIGPEETTEVITDEAGNWRVKLDQVNELLLQASKLLQEIRAENGKSSSSE